MPPQYAGSDGTEHTAAPLQSDCRWHVTPAMPPPVPLEVLVVLLVVPVAPAPLPPLPVPPALVALLALPPVPVAPVPEAPPPMTCASPLPQDARTTLQTISHAEIR
jgi:hypothetical protein